MTSLPDRCSDAEFERRHRLTREAMKNRGIDCLLCFGSQQGWGSVFYLTNHKDLISCYLLFYPDDATLFVGVFPYFEVIKRRDSVVRDVRFGGTKTIPLVIDELLKRGLQKGVIGLVEPDSFRIPGIPYKDMVPLRERLPGVTFIQATPVIEEIRRRKSDEEIGLLREGARLTDNALSAVVESVRPGVTERDLARVVTGSIGEATGLLVGSTPMSNPTAPYPTNRPTSRELRQGDVVMVELCLGFAGYAGQVLRTMTLGPPTDHYRDLYAIAVKSYEAIRSILRDGCTPQEVVEAAHFITIAGLTTGDPLVHGYGMGQEAGLHVGAPGHPAYWPPGDFIYPARASVSIEPNPCTPDMLSGVVTGGLVIIRESGCEELQKVPYRDIIQV